MRRCDRRVDLRGVQQLIDRGRFAKTWIAPHHRNFVLKNELSTKFDVSDLVMVKHYMDRTNDARLGLLLKSTGQKYRKGWFLLMIEGNRSWYYECDLIHIQKGKELP